MGKLNGASPMNWLLLTLLLCTLSLNAFGQDVADPFEGANRKSHALNQIIDERFAGPIASGYSHNLSGPLERSLDRFYGNFADVGDAVNGFLQGKPRVFLFSTLRVVINTTIGLGGFLDPASNLSLPNENEDFSQTLAKWGVPRGPYLVIPFLGPSSLRDIFGRAINNRLDPLRYLSPVANRNVLYVSRFVHDRANLLVTEDAIFGDRYLFFRDAYLQRRRYLELDGEINEDPFSDAFEDF
ncbi:MAG: hypothetical protein CMP89_08460 [Gammaproteobacteria bacterium]|nr:hypothetical protein [Gammaproteobacteria bacterium]